MDEQQILYKINQWERSGINKIKLALTDIDGVLRGKYISMEKFRSLVTGCGSFCDCTLGWDVNDQLYDNTTFTGWHTAYPDALYKLDFSTERKLKDEGGIPFYLGDYVMDQDGNDHPICPRTLLKKMIQKAKDMGFGVNTAFEYEFSIFKETAHSVRDKNYQNMIPLSPGMFGYSILRSSTESNLFTEFFDYCQEMKMELEALHYETGPGVWEAAINYDEGILGADKANLFKTFSKVFFQKRDMIATFMAKWSMNYPGQSGHVHLSLFEDKSGQSAFYDPKGHAHMSKTMEQFVAGMQKYLRPFLPMCAPTINSYARLVKGAWAPTSLSWGVDNRTTALRIIPGSPKSQRVEFRIGAADGNPYLVAASIIGAGLLGIEEKLKLKDEVKGNAYEVQDDLPEKFQLPTNLLDATRLFADSKEARKLFGVHFVNHFVSTREWEVREYERFVNDWQLKRYFEII